MRSKLRSGYTTGACAAATAKAAAIALLSQKQVSSVQVRFPDSSNVTFTILDSSYTSDLGKAAVIKDAGDDPDVTNGARIEAEVRIVDFDSTNPDSLTKIVGGKGVGLVTKPGLAVGIGKHAINPVPLQMIRENVEDAIQSHTVSDKTRLEVTIIVPDGEELAKKTLNARLGIIGGISILGTTGIVRPISAEAWTATIRSSMDVAQATDVEEIFLSTGRTSERCVQMALNPPEEALVMMGDYLEFSLLQVKDYRFKRVHVATMWAKLLKGAMGYAQTHVRHGALETEAVCVFLKDKGVDQTIIEKLSGSNTAREILEKLIHDKDHHVIELVCDSAIQRYQAIGRIPVSIHLVNGNGRLICSRVS